MNTDSALTSRQVELLKKLYKEGKTIEVHTVEKT
ncbi:MAG: Transcriptional regulatory protein, asnC family, partial [Thermococcales archaeon 44_46]